MSYDENGMYRETRKSGINWMDDHPGTAAKSYYVAGPMRGIAEFNFPAFLAKSAELRYAAHVVFCPAGTDMARGFDPTGLQGTDAELDAMGFSVREALAVDVEFISLHATHIYMLPGWANSKGATAERALGLALGLTIEGAPA